MSARTRERWNKITVALMLAVAAGVRLAGIGWGLPTAQRFYSYHPDEAPLLGAVVNMILHGDLNPHFFNYGTLYLYLVAIPAGIMRILSPGSLGQIFLTGRLVTVALGVLTVLVVYETGKAAGSRRLGVVAGWVLALLPMHVLHSHFATVDVAATFFVALVLLAAAHITTRAELSWYLIGGLGAGLAAATKYNAGLVILALLVASGLGVGQGRYHIPPKEWFYLSLLVAVLAFLAACPFVIEFSGGPHLGREFVRDLTFELRHAQQGGTAAFLGVGNGWAYHLARGLGAGLGYPLLLLALAGAGLAVWSIGRPAAPGLVFGAAHFLLIGLGREYFMRYLMPLTPLLALWTAGLLVWCYEMAEGQKSRLGMATVALVGVTVWGVTSWYALGQLAPLTHPDARALAGQALLAEKGRIGLPEPPWYFSPDVTPYNGGPLSAAQSAQDPRLLITGWDAAVLARQRPPWVAVSDLQTVPWVRTGNPEVRNYLAYLDREYRVQGVYESDVPGPALGPAKDDCPPDWLYARARITVYRSK